VTDASQRYRARAEECRAKAQSFRDARARAQMFKLADEYELKAKQAEASELEKNDSSDVGGFGGDSRYLNSENALKQPPYRLLFALLHQATN